jgi:phosphonoacetaldehyde hydrolase
MIFRIMEALGLYPPAAVLKVGDTVPDIGEGLHAGAWSVGVLRSSSEVGCTEAELAALPLVEREAKLVATREKLLTAGAHRVIAGIDEVPGLVCEIVVRKDEGCG